MDIYLHNKNMYGQNLIPSYDSLVPNKSLNLDTRGNGCINFNVSGTRKMMINYSDISYYPH